jgi:hypothetical protein
MQSWLISGGRKLAAWLRSRSGAAPTLMETEAVAVDDGRGRSAWDEAAGGRCLRTAAEGVGRAPLFVHLATNQ